MPFKLTSVDGTLSFELRLGPTQSVGRAPDCDLPVIDPTISRRHAELRCDGTGADVRDLASSNGTFINGRRVERGRIAPGDRVAFGTVEFTVIGDAVNTASRLCSAAGPGEILITDRLRLALCHLPELEERPPMELRGKRRAVPVFRVVA